MLKDNIKAYRLSVGLTQQELGKRIGVGKSTVSMYENGERTPPLDILKSMASIFNINIDALVGEKEKAPDKVPEAEDELVQLIRLMPEDMKKIYVDALRAALKAQGLIP